MAIDSPILNLPVEVIDNISFIITLLQAAGIILLLYFVYFIVSFIMNYKNNRRIKEIYERVGNIEKKLDKMTRKK